MNPKIKVLGIGGSGCNTISRIAKFGVLGVELVALNTDAQALHFSKADKKILIGKTVTRGLGAGMDMELGRKAAEENAQEITEILQGTDMAFITCGLGGGTGSGGSSPIAKISKDLGILTIAVVTMPFSFEGEQRKQIAKKALEELKGNVDSLLVISNDKLLKVIDEKTTVSNAFEICDDILKQAVQSITDVILSPGIINIDFASILSIMKNSGQALFGTGRGEGEHRAVDAAHQAIGSPLLDFSIKGSKGILFNASGSDVTLNEIQEAAKIITQNVDPKAQIIFGAVKDNTLKKGEIKITVIATHNFAS
jgi:cell division protein FtsZ